MREALDQECKHLVGTSVLVSPLPYQTVPAKPRPNEKSIADLDSQESVILDIGVVTHGAPMNPCSSCWKYVSPENAEAHPLEASGDATG